ncbi:NADH dehydrogenase [ubiquinone] 1 alpha subcomplex subunit 13 [Maniola jurtina]|uniref:NADH dehydrogenase [ubiquinone] 1 alpha subcomplex subunit 13 n=1 Tax=Maniola jurtina TaxID=191418 RepID=UPI001E68CE94|nr:NADH dehydrogenase [ubiquinone] 1 alpha subcomplex subunit 13 [Maniola jurtina]XP_045775844.1 NADH dehydrogenase [ubiquinone] 1 alpha subcomplex subunit 13 [Maniola jurtina]
MSEACQIARKQDLPPPGGYKPIPYLRLPAKQYFSGYSVFGIYIGVTAVAAYLYNITAKRIQKNEIEMRSAKMAIYPMLLAERDREYLKQLRRNRDAEAELMRDVPGWEVGTYYGERVYKLVPPDTLVEPIFHEYYAHSSPTEWYRRAYHKFRC